MKSPLRSAPDLVFGIYFWKKSSALETLKSNHLWFELQANNEVENRFWINDVEYPNILLIEVLIDRSVELTQAYLGYWRSFNCPIIWIINDEISHQSLSHSIYSQLLKDISPAGECILNHSFISDYSVTAIARNLLSRSHLQSQETTFSDTTADYGAAKYGAANYGAADFVHLQCRHDGHDRCAA